MRKGIIITALNGLFATSLAFGQGALDTEKYKDAELFVIKKGYDVQERIEEIKSIEGKEVTVYQVSGKQNRITLTYTGIAEMASHSEFSDKERATLITVRIIENGNVRRYFPLTNNKHFRIYLTEKMK